MFSRIKNAISDFFGALVLMVFFTIAKLTVGTMDDI